MNEPVAIAITHSIGWGKNVHAVQGSAHPRSHAGLVMLNNQYMEMDETRRDKYNYIKWCVFRRQYLNRVKKEKGELVCEYCGKRGLHINDYKKHQSALATIDHVRPLVQGASRYDESNFAVACFKCNQEKGPNDYTMVLLRKRNIVKYWLVTLKKRICAFLRFSGRS